MRLLPCRPEPVKPPADPENPKWANLSSNVGAQYFWVDRIFVWDAGSEQLRLPAVPHLAARARSILRFVSTDNINNPRTMNAIYNLGARLDDGQALGQGDARAAAAWTTSSSTTTCRQAGPLTQFFADARHGPATPRVLKDGADSVGALGALNRVYLNIGLFSEEWLLHFRPAGRRQGDLADRDRGRARELRYWQATEAQTPDLAPFFLQGTAPHRLRTRPAARRI